MNGSRQGARRIVLAGVLVLTVLAQLACATTYGKPGFGGGYYDRPTDDPSVIRVTFSGNGYTSKSRTQDYALYRAAQLTVENGKRYFEVVDERVSLDQSEIHRPGYSTSTTRTYDYGVSRETQTTTTHTPASTEVVNKYATTYMIRLLDDPANATGAKYYDAVKVFRVMKSSMTWRGPRERQAAEELESRVGD